MVHESPVLEARGLTKRFGKVTALRDVHLDLYAGEVHALCGENGAGKSTLIKILTGIHPAGSFEGHIAIEGTSRSFASIRDAERAGVAVIHQELALVDEMTVAENVFLGHEPTRWGLLDETRMVEQTKRLLQRLGVTVSPAARVGDLGVGQKQLVEIAKALRKESKILILDEPSAALSEHEVETLLDIIQSLQKRKVGCIYISHRLDEVFALAQRITVLRDGETVVTLEARETSQKDVIEHMVGRPLSALVPRRRSEPGDVVLEVTGLCVAARQGGPSRIRDVSFTVRKGEVLGVGGLMGAGRSELLMHLMGVWGVRKRGSVRLHGADLAQTPKGCIEQGLVLVSEDRKRYGLVLGQGIDFNMSLASLERLTQWGLVDVMEEARECRKYIDTLGIRALQLDARVGSLSGGNQQKVVLGKALMTRPSVLLLDEPTRGIDVGAKYEIYEFVNELTAAGLAVVLVSSELPELIGMSDRVLMLAHGSVGGHFDGDDIRQADLLAAALGNPDYEEELA